MTMRETIVSGAVESALNLRRWCVGDGRGCAEKPADTLGLRAVHRYIYTPPTLPFPYCIYTEALYIRCEPAAAPRRTRIYTGTCLRANRMKYKRTVCTHRINIIS